MMRHSMVFDAGVCRHRVLQHGRTIVQLVKDDDLNQSEEEFAYVVASKVFKDAQCIEGERRGGPQREFCEAGSDLLCETI